MKNQENNFVDVFSLPLPPSTSPQPSTKTANILQDPFATPLSLPKTKHLLSPTHNTPTLIAINNASDPFLAPLPSRTTQTKSSSHLSLSQDIPAISNAQINLANNTHQDPFFAPLPQPTTATKPSTPLSTPLSSSLNPTKTKSQGHLNKDPFFAPLAQPATETKHIPPPLSSTKPTKTNPKVNSHQDPFFAPLPQSATATKHVIPSSPLSSTDQLPKHNSQINLNRDPFFAPLPPSALEPKPTLPSSSPLSSTNPAKPNTQVNLHQDTFAPSQKAGTKTFSPPLSSPAKKDSNTNPTSKSLNLDPFLAPLPTQTATRPPSSPPASSLPSNDAPAKSTSMPLKNIDPFSAPLPSLTTNPKPLPASTPPSVPPAPLTQSNDSHSNSLSTPPPNDSLATSISNDPFFAPHKDATTSMPLTNQHATTTNHQSHPTTPPHAQSPTVPPHAQSHTPTADDDELEEGEIQDGMVSVFSPLSSLIHTYSQIPLCHKKLNLPNYKNWYVLPFPPSFIHSSFSSPYCTPLLSSNSLQNQNQRRKKKKKKKKKNIDIHQQNNQCAQNRNDNTYVQPKQNNNDNNKITRKHDQQNNYDKRTKRDAEQMNNGKTTESNQNTRQHKRTRNDTLHQPHHKRKKEENEIKSETDQNQLPQPPETKLSILGHLSGLSSLLHDTYPILEDDEATEETKEKSGDNDATVPQVC
jgi:hypothetical protein